MNWHLLEMSFVAKFSLNKGEKSFSDLSEKAESKAIGNCTEISGGCKDFLALRMQRLSSSMDGLLPASDAVGEPPTLIWS